MLVDSIKLKKELMNRKIGIYPEKRNWETLDCFLLEFQKIRVKQMGDKWC